jgi:hypothetical protein
MKTLREIIIDNVGTDIADTEYFRILGYAEETLNEIPISHATITGWLKCDVWNIGIGYHVSTDTTEMFVEYNSDEAEDIEALPENAWTYSNTEEV